MLGYTNWAYGHGYDFWERDDDIERAYKGNISDTLAVLRKYDASYVYVGKEEQKNAPDCLKKFEYCEQLEKVYEDPSGKCNIFELQVFV